MRLCLYNPHCVIGKTLFFSIFKINHHVKYDFLLELLRPPYSSAIIIDGTATSLTGGSILFSFISDNYFLIRIISFIEVYLWCFLNNINPFKQKIIYRTSQLNKKTDILFGFAFLTDTFLNKNIARKSAFVTFKGNKIIHANHYFLRTDAMSKLLRNLQIKTMVAEADLKKNSFFAKYFSFVKTIIVLPYVLRKRYKNKNKFSNRFPLCLAIGSVIHLGKNSEYYQFFKTETLQPMRDQIYKQQSNLKNYIDSKIYEWAKPSKKRKHKYHNIIEKIIHIFKPKINPYYSFDIVDEYNKYQMFIVPEENVGLPSINFIEGMACGCAFIGLKHSIYEDYGMKDKVHYIGYNGTIADLKKKILYYQKNQKKLKEIAKSGEIFVKTKFQKKKVLDEFMTSLQHELST